MATIKKKRKPKSKNYFTQETENAIILYNNTSSPQIRSRIYEREIHYPLFKLTQNIIHTFKFYYTEVEDLEHLQHEIIVFLLSKIHLYSHKENIQKRITKICKEFGVSYNGDFVEFIGEADRVTQEEINIYINSLNIKDQECLTKLKKLTPPKAYSYFGTIVKRWLILYNKKNYKKRIQKVDISDLVNENSPYSYKTEESDYKNDLDNYLNLFTEYVSENIYDLFPKKNDAQIADSILELFRKREDLEFFNKKALYIYIREMVDVKTPKITKIAHQLHIIFKSNYSFYLENGYVNF